MSRILSANDICARSLRAIGKFPVTETAPDPEDLREAMHWLDLILAETVGTMRLFSRIPDTLSLSIVNGTGSYNLYTALGAALPEDRIQFVVDAFLQDAAGNRYPLTIVTHEKFESVPEPAKTGPPEWLYFDRLDNPTLRIYPTPAATDETMWTVKLVCQRYAPNVAPAGVTGTKPSGSVAHGFGQAWQRWIVVQLAHDLGAGPIHKLPEARLARYEKMANNAKTALEAFENREHETEAPVCEPWGM